MVNLLKALNFFNRTGERIAQDASHWHHKDTLAEHDKKYHGGMFKGGRCLFRSRTDQPDILGLGLPEGRGSVAGETVTPQDEYDAVVAKYKGTLMWMKAPNGKKTNLTERQWVQVRTPSFKKWFGEWEKKAEVEAAKLFLLNREAVVSITGDEFQKDGRKLTDKVPEFFMREYGGYAVSPEFGRVELDKEGVKSDLGHGIRREKAAAFAAVHDVIEKGFVYNRAQNWKGRGWDSAVIGAPIKIGESDYICEVVIQKLPNRQGFYLHEVELKEKVGDAFKTHTQVGASPISKLIISKLSGEVYRDTDKISKVVDENGEPMVVYHGTEAKFTKFDSNKRGSRFGNDDEGFCFLSDKDFAEETYGGDSMSSIGVFINMVSPMESETDETPMAFWDDFSISGADHPMGKDGAIIHGFNFGNKHDRHCFTDEEWDELMSERYAVDMYVVPNSTQIKSATDNSGAFSSDEASTLDADVAAEKYLRMVEDESLSDHDKKFHPDGFDPDTDTCEVRERRARIDPVDSWGDSRRGNGYHGYSMSNNAVSAYENGEKPKSKWTKADILKAIAEVDPKKAELAKGIPLPVLKAEALELRGWHHSSSWYNEVDFFGLNEGFVANLNEETAGQLKKVKVEGDDAKVYKGDFDYIEWTGTRQHPKAIKHHLTNATIEERGSFYYVTDADGNQIKKKIGSNGTNATDYEEEKKREMRRMAEEENKRKYSTPAAIEFLGLREYTKDKDGIDGYYFDRSKFDVSMEGNVYARGRKPTRHDYADGLENFFKKGEKRAAKNSFGGYSIEEWDGKAWIREEEPFSEDADVCDERVESARKYLRLVEDESLEEHDKKYHGGHFDPESQTCGKREKMGSGDSADKMAAKGHADHYQGMLKSKDEVRRIVGKHLDEAAEEIGIRVIDFEIHGSRGRGTAREDSDLDVVFEYDDGEGEEITTPEDYVFNRMARLPLEIDGIKVDFNPINAEDTGTLEEYMERDKAYDAEKVAERQRDVGAEKRVNGVTAAEDAAYMDAVKRGDMETCARMVREAAAKAWPDTKVVGEDGKPMVVYRGTPKKDIGYVFQYGHNFYGGNRGFWFSSSFERAKNYSRDEYTGEEGDFKSVFLNFNSMLDMRPLKFWTDYKRAFEYLSKNYDRYIKRFRGDKTVHDIYESNQDEIYRGKEDGLVFCDEQSWSFVAKVPNQIKSADPVTYDDDGKPIPLSRRFDDGDDIRGGISR